MSYQQPAQSTFPWDAQASDTSRETDPGPREASTTGPEQTMDGGAETSSRDAALSGDERVSDGGHGPERTDGAIDANAPRLDDAALPSAGGASSEAAPDAQSGTSSSSGGSSSGTGPLACSCDGGQAPYPTRVTTCTVIGNGASAVCSPSGFVGDDPGCLGTGTLLLCTPIKNPGGVVQDCLPEEISAPQTCH